MKWPENELVECIGKASFETISISPAGAMSGGQFKAVRPKLYKIIYHNQYKSDDGKDVYFDCSVNFTVKCECMQIVV